MKSALLALNINNVWDDMSRLDRIKAEIAFHEKMLFASIAAMLALIGWLTAKYQDQAAWLVFLGVAALFGICVFGIDQYRRIKKLLVELEEC